MSEPIKHTCRLAIRAAIKEAARRACRCPGGPGGGSDTDGHYISVCAAGRILDMLEDYKSDDADEGAMTRGE